ncbi:flagellar hook-associated protein FlgK [Cellulomonas endophytica]|uniref:flagellar hook-associated protein FlgK n=1 Tax=Cellulomonas endophytica TaxID=2494735 RepID=UPI001010E2E4|nr:flagellar hook-associated protein FlgK [Cellulomonas endophytica]
MSTFSGIGTALSSLNAHRQALDVTSQNVANANTVGYTRQRATMVASPTAVNPSMFQSASGVGDGVRVTGVERLADAFLDAQVRSASSSASYQGVRSTAYTTLEASLGEPSKTSLSSQMSQMWSAFEDLANNPHQASARTAVLSTAAAVTDKVGALYSSVRDQWTQARDQAVSLVDQVNAKAQGIADLNGRILATTNVGGNANELVDQRERAITELAGLTGATSQTRANGTVDVLVGGNPLVEGSRTNALVVTGAPAFADAAGGAPVTVSWAHRPGSVVALSGGSLAGQLSVLAPADAAGTGGVLAEAAARLDTVATELADQVNTLHQGGYTAAGATGTDFFRLEAGLPAALGLRVAVPDGDGIAASGVDGAAYDGGVADAIHTLSSAARGPQALWAAGVVDTGNRSASATARATVAEAARAQAESQQTSAAAVDTDEETVNLMAYQRGYQAAARVLSTIDSVLETLMNMAR